MADLPHPWGIYARLQDNLRREHRVGDRSWGTEAGMDHILDAAAGLPPAEDDVNLAIATGRRRERHRGSRRDYPLLEDFATPHPQDALNARRELAEIRCSVGNDNFELLTAVAIGWGYKEISVAMLIPLGLARVRVSRLRAALVAAA